MADFDWQADDVELSLKFGCTGGNGPDLTGYPLLVYAPDQHGPGVRTNDNVTPVDAIAKAYRVLTDIDVLARQFGTTAEHIKQALAYAAANEETSAQCPFTP